jgi:hypothetical protein
VTALRNYLTSAYEAGFLDALPGVSLALYAVVKGAGKGFRVSEHGVREAELADVPIASLDWQESTLDSAVQAIAQL